MKIKPHKNLTDEIFYRQKIPKLQYLVAFTTIYGSLVFAVKHYLQITCVKCEQKEVHELYIEKKLFNTKC